MKNNSENLYQKITNAMLKQLESGVIPWQKPWQAGAFMGCVSHSTGRPYSMLNQMLLEGRAGEWLTYKQITAEGGRVKSGEKSSTVVFWSFVEMKKTVIETDENGNEIETIKAKRFPMLKGYSVFHIDQCEGIKPKYNNEVMTYEHEPIEIAEQIASEYVEREAIILNVTETDRAFYRPSQDYVEIPEMKQFKCGAEYYSTLFHELTHSTGHAKRLNREEISGLHFFGDEGYSKEELVAEMGAAFLCSFVGIDCAEAFQNSAAYVQGWLHALRDDKKLVVAAASKAEAAVNFILNGTK